MNDVPPDAHVDYLTEHPSDAGGGALGRHVVHDPRNRAYPVRAVLARLPGRPRPWWRRGIFDQNVGGPWNGWRPESSCTVQATSGQLLTSPLRAQTRSAHPQLASAEFRWRVYRQAQTLDPWPGDEDTDPRYAGSSGGAACQALVALGAVGADWQYRWCFGVADVLDTLTRLGPVAIGTRWYAGFDRPAPNGLLEIGGDVRGGHETELVWYDETEGEVLGVNSWGTAWGPIKGRFRMAVATLERLLGEDGDAVAWVPPALVPPAT